MDAEIEIWTQWLLPYESRLLPLHHSAIFWRFVWGLNPWPPTWQAGVLSNWTNEPYFGREDRNRTYVSWFWGPDDFQLSLPPYMKGDSFNLTLTPLSEPFIKRVNGHFYLVILMRFELMSSDRKSDILDHYTIGPYCAVIIKTIISNI